MIRMMADHRMIHHSRTIRAVDALLSSDCRGRRLHIHRTAAIRRLTVNRRGRSLLPARQPLHNLQAVPSAMANIQNPRLRPLDPEHRHASPGLNGDSPRLRGVYFTSTFSTLSHRPLIIPVLSIATGSKTTEQYQTIL